MLHKVKIADSSKNVGSTNNISCALLGMKARRRSPGSLLVLLALALVQRHVSEPA